MKIVRLATSHTTDRYVLELNEDYCAFLNDLIFEENPDFHPLTVQDLEDFVKYHEDSDRFHETIYFEDFSDEKLDYCLGDWALAQIKEDLWDFYDDTFPTWNDSEYEDDWEE